MSDATSLRSLLTRVDATAPAIQSTAGAMMRHYDRSAGVAVVEWRNALHNSQRDQWLPLLYVANEVLQNSKRNRGNKFLEAFSPILGQSLIFVCQHSDGSVVEKIRRTVKIWGDRRVFSVRYVNELLKGLEPYRNNRGATAPPPQSNMTVHEDGTFSPQPNTTNANANEQQQHPTNNNEQHPATTTPSPHQHHATTGGATQTTTSGTDNTTTNNDDNDDDDGEESDDPMDIFQDNNDDDNNNENDNDSGDDEDVFGSSDGGAKLDVEINFDSSALNSPPSRSNSNANNNSSGSGLKRRRSSTASAGSHSSQQKAQKRRKSKVLSTHSLSELWKQVSSLQQSFDHSTAMLRDIHLPDQSELENLVGDELLEHYHKVCQQQERVLKERQTLHRIATERRTLEQQAVRYIPWLEAALKQDADDIEFCRNLETQLSKFKLVHPAIRDARNKRVEEEVRYRREQEEKERKRKQEEESKRFREAALSKQEEAKPGMVWNKVTQEYQYLNTDESWRD